ncbi:hypothetical protein [Peribacillus asahii]|uniref:Uncharacterized protein n=1 Tax=Peribacillus asahii TaxID=228899 RepID=A0A3T0KLV8_9BACI|nr:hypothetical protein [Peribacillus asahii]AZV41366.1 hypothetical protein BAOM_0734 [Peribacillus asahii]USK85774.1 hypothetical protein LIT35_03665 [Peribacillus asahii]
MVTLSSVDELQTTEEALEKIKDSYPELFKKLLHVVGLTRAFQFKYQYMGCLIMDEDASEFTPEFVMPSVISLYKEEIQKLKDDPNIHILQKTFADYETIGYAKISMLVLGQSPESLLGASYIK